MVVETWGNVGNEKTDFLSRKQAKILNETSWNQAIKKIHSIAENSNAKP